MPKRLHFSRDLITSLRLKVIDHNKGNSEAAQTRLEELKRVYAANHRGKTGHDRAMRAVDRHLADLCRRQGLPLPSPADCERLADAYLGQQEYGPRLLEILRLVARMATEAASHAEGKRRRELFEGALKHAKGLRLALQQLDRRSIATLMGPTSIPMPHAPVTPLPVELESDPAWAAIQQALMKEEEKARTAVASAHQLSILPLRLAEFDGFVDQLETVTRALADLSEATPIPMGRPKLDDPLIVGIRALGHLWVRARGCTPRQSFNRHSFGDLALQVLGEQGLGYPVTEIQTAVRRVLEEFAPPDALPNKSAQAPMSPAPEAATA